MKTRWAIARFSAILAVLIVATPSTAQKTAGRIFDIAVRDSATGYAVESATIKWGQIGPSIPESLPNSGVTDESGLLRLKASAGHYAFEISAPGYQQMRTHFEITPGGHQAATVNLDPVAEPLEVREDVASSESHPESQIIRGYVADSVSHKPLAGVRLRLQRSGSETATNERGYFKLIEGTNSPERPVSPVADLPETDTLVAKALGYKTYVLSHMILVRGGDSTFQIDMEKGMGSTASSTN